MSSQTRLCHRCGYRPPDESAAERCPADDLYLITESDHRRAPRDPFLGTVLGGRYPVLGLIGTGAMGTVYRSVQPYVDRPVAIKVIQPRPASERSEADIEHARPRFLREAKAVAALHHPGVIALYDFGVEDDGTLFMVQELVSGRTLRTALPEMTPRDLAGVATRLLEALHHAHSRGLVHRDVKPENIVLPSDGGPASWPKLLDFGIAKLTRDGTGRQLTSDDAVFGTPAYMAPEQWRAATGVDGRADLYSVGVILYEGLAGRRPYDGSSAISVLARIMRGRVPPLVPRKPVPAALVEAVERSLAREPDRRFATAAEMARALGAIDWDGPLDLPTTAGVAPGPEMELQTTADPLVPTAEPASPLEASATETPRGEAAGPPVGRGPRRAGIVPALLVGGTLTALATILPHLGRREPTNDRLGARRAASETDPDGSRIDAAAGDASVRSFAHASAPVGDTAPVVASRIADASVDASRIADASVDAAPRRGRTPTRVRRAVVRRVNAVADHDSRRPANVAGRPAHDARPANSAGLSADRSAGLADPPPLAVETQRPSPPPGASATATDVLDVIMEPPDNRSDVLDRLVEPPPPRPEAAP